MSKTIEHKDNDDKNENIPFVNMVSLVMSVVIKL